MCEQGMSANWGPLVGLITAAAITAAFWYGVSLALVKLFGE